MAPTKPPSLRVDTGRITNQLNPGSLGLNVNFVGDHAESRKRGPGYVAAMKRLGARSLRYPGGEKSNEYLWSSPPWDRPRPRLAITGPKARLHAELGPTTADGRFLVEPMDFDEFMEICRETGALPTICVNLNSAYITDDPAVRRGTPRSELLTNAVEWVRYANKVKGYGIRNWEIGNESYWRGSAVAMKAEDYARDVIEFSRAMKAVDPAIRIGANGHVAKDAASPGDGDGGPKWWQVLLTRAARDIDFAVIHPYPCFEWGSYGHFARNELKLTDAVDEVTAALREWAPADAARIRVQATETNAFDWAASKWYTGNNQGWKWANDLGHGLVLFELLGQHLADPRVELIQVWTTRWFDPTSRLEDLLDDDNGLRATGEGMGMWGRHLKDNLAKLAGTTCGPAYASWSPQTGELALFLMNKTRDASTVEVEIAGGSGEWQGTGEVLCGESENDLHPKVASTDELASRGGKISVTLPPVSITVLELLPKI